MTPSFLLNVLLGIVAFEYLLNLVLSIVNDKARKLTLPEEAKGIYDEEKYSKSMQYGRENSRFSYFSATFSFLLTCLVLIVGFFGWLDGMLAAQLENEMVAALIFFGVLFVASDLINLPFQLYDTFVIEEKYGFNKTTATTFFKDKLKSYLLSIISGGGLIYLFLALIESLGTDFWWVFWVVAAGFMFVMNLFYSSLILPLFNKLTPLPQGELKTAIEEYCIEVGFPLDNLYVIDGSKRSSKANAFFSGMGKRKKIVLYDTLINAHSTEELVAVLAHEVGHYKKKHIVWSYIMGIGQIGFTLFLLSLLIFNENLSLALGASGVSIPVNLIAFSILFSPISTITGLLMNVLSRKNEYEADEYAAKTYKAKYLQSALKKLSVNNLSNLFPHKWYVFFHYSHPPLLQRLRALDKFNV